MTVDRLRAAFKAGFIEGQEHDRTNPNDERMMRYFFDEWYQRELAKLTPPEIPMLDKATMTPMQRIAADEAKEPYDLSLFPRPGDADYRDKYTGMGKKLARSIMGDNSGPYDAQGITSDPTDWEKPFHPDGEHQYVLGSTKCIWCDHEATSEEIAGLAE